MPKFMLQKMYLFDIFTKYIDLKQMFHSFKNANVK